MTAAEIPRGDIAVSIIQWRGLTRSSRSTTKAKPPFQCLSSTLWLRQMFLSAIPKIKDGPDVTHYPTEIIPYDETGSELPHIKIQYDTLSASGRTAYRVKSFTRQVYFNNSQCSDLTSVPDTVSSIEFGPAGYTDSV